MDIRPDHLAVVQDILREHLPAGVKVWVFGSRANWSTKDSSDLDLALEGENRLSHKLLGTLKDAFDDSALPYTVDVVDLNRIGDSFRQIVMSQRTSLLLDGDGANQRVRLAAPLTGRSAASGTTRRRLAVTTERHSRVGWREALWGDLATLEYGKSLRDYNSSDGRHRVYGTNGPIGWHSEPLCHEASVIIGRKGAYRGVHYSPDPFFVIDTAFYLQPKVELDTRWAYYQLLTVDINGMDSGSAIPSTSREDFYGLPVEVPPLVEQRAIAHILGTLDDKIELNRRMNETLEAMARALFKSWFVDFEPVRAKMEGRWRRGESLPGLPAEHYGLFPDRLVDSELGEVPEGWEVKGLGEVALQRRSGVKPEEIDAESPYIALEHMPKRCIALRQWSNADGLASGKFKFEQGDILFGKLRPYFHKVGVAPLDGVCSTDIVVVQPKSNLWFGFVLGHTSSAEFVDYTDATSTGTRMPRTNWADMARYKVALPSIEVSKAFTRLVEPCVNRIVSAIHESHSLAAQRDALLPRLVSGKVGVEDANEPLHAVKE